MSNASEQIAQPNVNRVAISTQKFDSITVFFKNKKSQKFTYFCLLFDVFSGVSDEIWLLLQEKIACKYDQNYGIFFDASVSHEQMPINAMSETVNNSADAKPF